jgi:hypothetical protein
MDSPVLNTLTNVRNAFRMGDKVVIIRKVGDVADWNDNWNEPMDVTVGLIGTVTDVSMTKGGFRVITESGEFWYPSCALKLVTDPVNEAHIASLFKAGDRVKIVMKITKAIGWRSEWAPMMDKKVGKFGTVMKSDEYGVNVQITGEAGPTYWYPSCSLTYDSGGNMIPSTITTTKPKKRSRVKAGPWDAAPCTHLRWNLMGFFREKLALVKTNITLADGSVVPVTQVDVACTKCKTKMTLQAK